MLNYNESFYLQNMLPFWDSLTSSEKRKLQNGILFRTFSKEQIIHNGANDCLGLFLVISGQVRVSLTSESGKAITLYRLLERDICIFTAACMLKNIDFEVYVEAEKETEALLIPTMLFDTLSKTNLAVNEYTKELLSSKFSDVVYILGQTLFSSFDKRLANFLLDQSNIELSNTIEMTHEAIANNLGTAREVVTRMLKTFQVKGLVLLHRSKIEILDRRQIQNIVDN